MTTKLQQAKAKLQFIGRALDSGYVDADVLDELGRELHAALRLIGEHEQGEQQPLPLNIPARRITIYERA